MYSFVFKILDRVFPLVFQKGSNNQKLCL